MKRSCGEHGRPTLLRFVSEGYDLGDDPLDALQSAMPTVLAVDAATMLAGPAFDHLLGVVPGEVLLG